MKQFLLTVAGVFAGLVLFFVGVPLLVLTLIASAARPAPAPARTVLALDLRQSLLDQSPQNPFAAFTGRSLSVISLVRTLRQAETDDRVKALFIRLPEGGLPPAAADELRLAIRAFRAKGKPVLAHSQGVYPTGAAVSTYMLGASTGEFWMQPGSTLQAVGMVSEDLFLKRLFDRYGVVADYQQRQEYKNAVNPYLFEDYTPAHREATLAWMGSVHDTAVAAAASDRRRQPAQLKALLEAGPHDAEAARAAGLVDRVGHVREAEASLLRRAGAGAKMVKFEDYEAPDPDRPRGEGAVAVIQAEGAIITGTSANQGFGQGQTVYADDIAKAFQDAVADRSVRAIVFRISSPGGSDTASEQILAAVNAAKAAGKPVIVSMGTYAASGGYWVASQASHVVAQPSTLTGSIGVYGGKFVLGEALSRVGVDVRDLTVGGEYADAFGTGQPFTAEQRAAFAGWMDRIYEGFVQRVSAGRKLPPERVREIAKGRVWTGAQARSLGLVDELGGFHEALAAAKRLARLPADQDVRLKFLPSPQSPFDLLSRAMGVSADGVRALSAAAWLMSDPRAQALVDQASRARLGVQGGTVLAPTPLN